MNTQTHETDLLRPSQVARILNVARSTVYYWIATGRLEGKKLPGKTIRIERKAIKEAQKSTLS